MPSVFFQEIRKIEKSNRNRIKIKPTSDRFDTTFPKMMRHFKEKTKNVAAVVCEFSVFLQAGGLLSSVVCVQRQPEVSGAQNVPRIAWRGL